jgi:hypothetical protein
MKAKLLKWDCLIVNFKWYRKLRKKKWYKHEFTNDALELSINFVGTFWALYGNINRYSIVINFEDYEK